MLATPVAFILFHVNLLPAHYPYPNPHLLSLTLIPFQRFLLNQLPSSNALQTLLKSRHQIESLLFLLDSSRLLQLPYLESNTFAHNSPWRWKRHHHFLSRARLNFTKSKYGQFELLEGNFNFVHCVLYKWFHWLRKSNHICHFLLIYYLWYLVGLFVVPCCNFQSLGHDWIACTRLQNDRIFSDLGPCVCIFVCCSKFSVFLYEWFAF